MLKWLFPVSKRAHSSSKCTWFPCIKISQGVCVCVCVCVCREGGGGEATLKKKDFVLTPTPLPPPPFSRDQIISSKGRPT